MSRYCVGMCFWIEADSSEEATRKAHAGEEHASSVAVDYCHVDEPDDDEAECNRCDRYPCQCCAGCGRPSDSCPCEPIPSDEMPVQ